MSSSGGQRATHIVDVLSAEFGASMAIDPAAFRRRLRKMAASPFAFYRGSAALFYADQLGDFADDRFLDERTGRVWIHGDLHAENFGTYMNASGQLVFNVNVNVNDFDEAYVGPFTWDLRRLPASVALLGYGKALSDTAIGELVAGFARSYLTELRAIAAGGDDAIGSITLDNADGVLRRVLQQARLNTRVDLLAAQTTIDNAADLDWSDVNEPEELTGVLVDLGRAVARMHSVADDESSHDLVDYSTEEAIVAAVDGDEPGFVNHLVDFAHAYGVRARQDHQLFVDLFRNGRLPGI
ncbi:DUF2252 family protein [Micromonospora sp. WMMD1120]|uniref:DUF2252 family protein n=1 Tax=Micromonospora sp. WMMD1120 TaxID=3016106 RepID=UPI002415B4A3|nr:DUF2252 family protein [Micromonospora sp. WMMD1120]MDG4806317.1 DUF2252 family protein [Micromonospora sp. WMMD1120]